MHLICVWLLLCFLDGRVAPLGCESWVSVFRSGYDEFTTRSLHMCLFMMNIFSKCKPRRGARSVTAINKYWNLVLFPFHIRSQLHLFHDSVHSVRGNKFTWQVLIHCRHYFVDLQHRLEQCCAKLASHVIDLHAAPCEIKACMGKTHCITMGNSTALCWAHTFENTT